LSPLSEDESLRLVGALLDSDGLPPGLTERIVARAEGNPFHVEEILQMLIDRGALARENGRWSVRSTLDSVDLPDSVHGVIAARIDLLEPSSRDGLRRCSAVGRVFWPEAVDVDDDVIAALARRGLVTEHADSTIEGTREFAVRARSPRMSSTRACRGRNGAISIGAWAAGSRRSHRGGRARSWRSRPITTTRPSRTVTPRPRRASVASGFSSQPGGPRSRGRQAIRPSTSMSARSSTRTILATGLAR
jgi:hypothetical protein